MLDYYAKRAAEYERIYAKPERAAELAELKPRVSEYFAGRHVLELACGTGYWTEAYAPAAQSVVATDANDDVLAIARSKAYPADRVMFRNADAYAPEAIAGDFDAAFAGFWWSHVPKARLPQFLAALHARLPHGAKVLFLDNNYVPGSSTPIARSDDEGNTYQQRRLDNGDTFEVMKNFPDPAELRAAVAGVATDVEVKCLHYYWWLSCTIKKS